MTTTLATVNTKSICEDASQVRSINNQYHSSITALPVLGSMLGRSRLHVEPANITLRKVKDNPKVHITRRSSILEHTKQESCVPRRLRYLPLYQVSSKLLLLISHRIMQRMRSNIPPKPIQPYLPSRRPRPRNLKHPTRNSQSRVRSHDLHARNPLRQVPSLSGCNVAPCAVVVVDAGDLFAGDVCKRFGGAEVREKGAVALEDVGLVGAGGDRVWGVGPRAGILAGVGRAEGEGA